MNTTIKNNYDAIIIGAGHNGLITAAYLAKAGLKVAIFESRHIVGGCAVTEELWPGFKISRLSYVNSLFKPEIIEDLKLKNYGFELLPRNPSSFTPYPDGRYLIMGADAELNQKEISKFSRSDAEKYPKYEAMLTEIAELLEPMMTMTPLNLSKISFSEIAKYGSFGFKNRDKLKKLWPEMMRLFAGSANSFLNEWFESDELKSTLATDAVIGTNASPSQSGTAYVLFHHVMGECDGARGVWGYMRGGMGGVTQSLASACKELGVEIFLNAPVSQIMIQNQKASGVILNGGREYSAKTLISAVDPNATFNKLMNANELPESFARNIKRISYDSASVKINLALKELPNFKACPGTSVGPQHKGTIHICPSTQYIEEAYSDSIAGRPSKNPILEASIPSSIDNTIAPEGMHVMNIFSQYGPYELKNGKTWDECKEDYAKRCFEIMNEYAPNFKDSILQYEVLTPLDLEREWNLTGGNITHGRMTLDQMFNMRPAPGFSDYKTPIDGLFICGSGTHPGGGVMGTPGFNAAKVILKSF